MKKISLLLSCILISGCASYYEKKAAAWEPNETSGGLDESVPELRVGMTEEEVVEYFGKPDKVEVIRVTPDSTTVVYKYRDVNWRTYDPISLVWAIWSRHKVDVEMTDGKVTDIRADYDGYDKI